MKAKRRQELKTNDLAAWLEETWKSASKWGGYVVGGAAIVVLVLVIGMFRSRAETEAVARAFKDLDTTVRTAASSADAAAVEVARPFEKIDALIAESGNAAFKLDALIRKGALALDMVGKARADAAAGTAAPDVTGFLAEGRRAFEQVVQKYQDHPIQYGRALWGLFQIESEEFALDGDVAHKEKAEQYLSKIRDDKRLNGTPLQMAATDYLNDLDGVFTVVVLDKRPTPSPKPDAAPGTAIGPVVTPVQVPDPDDADLDTPVVDEDEIGDVSEAESSEMDDTEDDAPISDEDPERP